MRIYVSYMFLDCTNERFIRLGDPKDTDSGYLIACLPHKQCRLTKEYNGEQIFKLEQAIGANDVLSVLKRNAISLESVKYPGYFMVERIKNGKKIIMLDKVDKSSLVHSRFSCVFIIIGYSGGHTCFRPLS